MKRTVRVPWLVGILIVPFIVAFTLLICVFTCLVLVFCALIGRLDVEMKS